MATEKIRIDYEVDKKQLDASNKSLKKTAELNELTQKEVDETNEKFKDQEKQLSKTNKAFSGLGDSIGDVGEQSKKAKEGVGTLTKATGKFGGALKLLGIGLIIAAFAKFTEALLANQRVADFLTKATKTLGIAFNDLINLIIDSGSSVTKIFKQVKEGLESAFNDPLAAIEKLAESVKANLIERFESFIDTLGHAARAIKQVFEGDFNGAMESAKKAAKEFVDVTTGVPNSVDKLTDAVTKGASAAIDYAKATFASADALVELEKSAQLAEIQQQRLIQQNERAAEQQRQIRDDTSITFAERIAANEKLFVILDRQEKLEKAQANEKTKRADLLLAQDKTNLEAQLAKQEALLLTEDIENRIEGQRSEALVNRVALTQEQTEKIREQNLISAQTAILQAETADDALDAEINRRDILLENEKLVQEERDLIVQESSDRQDEIKAASTAFQNDLEATKLQNKRDTLNLGVAALVSVAEKESKIGKAAAIAQTIINTAQGITRAIADYPFPISAVIAGIVGTLGTIQTAKIAGITPKFEKGGKIGGNLHSNGGTLIEAEKNEFVMSRRATSKYGFDFMDKINNLELNDITTPTGSATVNIVDTNPIAQQLKNMPQNIMNIDEQGFELRQRRGQNTMRQKLTRYST